MSQQSNPQIERLKNLKADVDRILEEAIANPRKLPGAINWGDLKCVEASHCITDEGAEYLSVWIEEADSGSTSLHTHVYKKLVDLGWKDSIRVTTEW